MTVNVGEAGKPAEQHTPSKPPPMKVKKPREPIGWLLGRLDIKYSPYAYIAPFFILFAIFGLYPLLYTIYLSTRKWDLLTGDEGSVGLQNYKDLLVDEQFWNAMMNTFGIFLMSTIPQLLLALVIASWLNKRLRFRTALRMGVLLPYITSTAAVGILFGLIFADRYGMANWLLQSIGLDGIEWRNHWWSSWFAISIMVNWRWTGYNALIYLGAMQAIPNELYESAAIDGASSARRFFRITLPLIQPTILFTVIVSTIGGMQLFTEPLLFDPNGKPSGGTLNEFQTVAMYIYETTFTNKLAAGYGAAISWTLFMIIMVFSVVNQLIVRRSVRGAQ